jgi:hypothetical protein
MAITKVRIEVETNKEDGRSTIKTIKRQYFGATFDEKVFENFARHLDGKYSTV